MCIRDRPKSYESSSFFKLVKGKKFDLVFLAFSDYPFNFDPKYKWNSTVGGNYASFGTAESDDLIKKMQEVVDVEKQNEMSKQLQAMIYEEQPAIFLAIDTDRMLVNKKFGQITAFGISPRFRVNEFNGNALVTSSK